MIIKRWIVEDYLNNTYIFDTEKKALEAKEMFLRDFPGLKTNVSIKCIKIMLSESELRSAHYETEILSIMDDVINRWENYSPEHDHEVRACAEEVYDEMMNDEYFMETYDNALYEHLDEEMENRGLI